MSRALLTSVLILAACSRDGGPGGDGGPTDAPTPPCTASWFEDADGDGFAGTLAVGCTAPSGAATETEDCDDADPTAWPGAPEACGSERDCDGVPTICRMSDVPLMSSDGLHGRYDGGELGFVVGGGGDYDGDGFDDVVVIGRSSGGVTPPRALVFRGPDLPADDTAPYAEIAQSEGLDWLGTFRLVDVDLDGTDELLVGGSEHVGSDYGSKLCLFTGGAAGLLDATDATACFSTGTQQGGVAAGATAPGDVTGDGIADLWVGLASGSEPGEQGGGAYLFAGPFAGDRTLAEAEVRLESFSPNDAAGTTIHHGDHDGDGVVDLAVGAPREGGLVGAVYVATGPIVDDGALPFGDGRWVADLNGQWIGNVVRLADLDGDGRDDLVFDAWDRVALVADPATRGGTIAELDGWFDPDAGPAGLDVADLDGDGAQDLVVGTPDDNGDLRWLTFVVYGPIPGLLADRSDADAIVTGAVDGDYLGQSLAVAGDFDGDGALDVVLGAHLDDGLAPDGGAVYVLDGYP